MKMLRLLLVAVMGSGCSFADTGVLTTTYGKLRMSDNVVTNVELDAAVARAVSDTKAYVDMKMTNLPPPAVPTFQQVTDSGNTTDAEVFIRRINISDRTVFDADVGEVSGEWSFNGGGDF